MHARWTLWIGAFAWLATSCRTPATHAPHQTVGPVGELSGVDMRDFAAPQPAPGKTVGESLGADEVTRLLARAPAMSKGEQVEFALREASQPPPRTGDTVTTAFPPPPGSAAPAVAAGPLEVTRFQPEGEVELAPQLSVSFSRPVVAITTVEEAERTIPVKLTPEPPGHWRWVGTQTLLFEPRLPGKSPSGDTLQRFPMATDFQVDVPAGLRAADGQTLAKTQSFHFRTPAPRLVAHLPGPYDPQDLQPVIFLGFDQAVDPAAVLATVQVDGRHGADLRLASADELAHDRDAAAAAKSSEAGRWLALVTVKPLDKAKGINVSVGPGTPSREGPRTTAKAQTFEFTTYSPLELIEHHCDSGWDICAPGSAFRLVFNNPLDAKRFDAKAIHITPALPEQKLEVAGSEISVSGQSRGRMTYQVLLPASLTDRFGQTLGRASPVSVDMGQAMPAFSAPDSDFVVLDPASRPRVPIFTVNQRSVRVRAFRVAPADVQAFYDWKRAHERWLGELADNKKGGKPAAPEPTPPGHPAMDRVVATPGAPDTITEQGVELAPALVGGAGVLVVWIEATKQPPEVWRHQEWLGWVEVTKLGLDAAVDGDHVLAWVTRLGDGTPVAGATVDLSPSVKQTATTDATGLAELPLPGGGTLATALVAHLGKDTVVLPRQVGGWGSGGWTRASTGTELAWLTFDDRNLYRPGEKVHVKGWLREVDWGKGGDVHGVPAGIERVTYVVTDALDNQIAKGEAKVDAAGGFDGQFALPKTPNLGAARVAFTAEPTAPERAGRLHNLGFEIQEFRRPEFEVSASTSEGVHYVGGKASATVTASYYAGGGLPGAEVVWQIRRAAASYAPPGHDDYSFGGWEPWWGRSYDSNSNSQRVEGVTSASGTHTVELSLDPVELGRPTQITASASVMDVNRQSWSATAELLAHAGDLYVGLKTDRSYLPKGNPILVSAIVADLDGKLREGRSVEVRAVRRDWVNQDDSWVQVDADPQTCTTQPGADPGKCEFKTPEGGQYRIKATVLDDEKRPATTEVEVWVTGGDTPQRNLEQDAVTLIPDKKEYQPGDTAKLLVQAPFTPAEGLLTVRRGGVIEKHRFHMASAQTTVEVALVESHYPGVQVEVDVVGQAARADDKGRIQKSLPKRPAFAGGALSLAVPPRRRTLALEVKPGATALDPGGSTSIDLTVRDAEGKPVAGAQVALVAVDEAVLDLSGYRLPDPIAQFYRWRGDGTSDHHLRELVMLGKPQKPYLELDEQAADKLREKRERELERREAAAARKIGKGGFGIIGHGEGGGGYGAGVGYGAASAGKISIAHHGMVTTKAPAPGNPKDEPVKLRKNFDALALFAPAVATGPDGHARVALKLPDSLTRYRIMAVAVAGERDFGRGEAAVTARLPLMVRPSPPRFLNFGDRVELPVVVQNQTDAAMTVEVALRTSNLALIAASGAAGTSAGRRVQVPAHDRVEVRFPAAAVMAGKARFQVVVTSGERSDAAEGELPVWTPATSEAFATYGVIDQGAISQPVASPPGAYRQFGGLEITTSSTQLGALTDAVLYLVRYPHECAEQLSSRLLAVAGLKDVLGAFQAAGMPPQDVLLATVKEDIKRLASMQNYDGGFGFWQRGDDSWPFVTVFVTHALSRAHDKGFDVPAETLQMAQRYLKDIEAHIPAWYPPEVRRAIAAFALYVRAHMGDRDGAKARALLAEVPLEEHQMETLAWLWPALAGDSESAADLERIRRHVMNRVSEEAGTAHWTTSYGDSDYLLLHSDRRVDGILLEDMIATDPNSDLIPKVVRGLLAHRSRGAWQSTQENAWVLLALDAYFHAFEKDVPDFTARAWLGQLFAGEHKYQGRTTEQHLVNVPMAALGAAGTQQALVLAKDGTGRMYFRIGMQYAPKDLHPPASEHGFTVLRSYEAIDKPDDVTRDKDGTWHVRAGAQVRVRLTMVAPARRYHVALTDPLPAGLEAMNPALKVTGPVPQDPKAQTGYWWWSRPWYEHQNLRDDRVEAFTSLLWEGVHNYSYVARATTPGSFVVPPTKAEEMYAPELFGRSSGDRMVIE